MPRSTSIRVDVTGDVSGLRKSLKKGESRLGKFGKAAGRAGIALAKGLGVGAAAAAGASVKAFADFDAAMNESLAIMGDVSGAMRTDMSDAAREVAKTTKFSAKESAESYFLLGSAGLDARQSIEALPQVAKFAQAGMFDMATATDLATDAQSALGLASDDAEENLENLTRVTDVLVKSNTLANASVEQFATALTQKAGGALRNVNKDVEEGAAVLSVFADQGIKAERAGTILRSTLDGMSKQARDNTEAFEKFGVEVFDAEGEMRNMADITADLEQAFDGMSTQQREAALEQLGFNQRAREGILALLGNSEALAEYEEKLRDAGGTTEEIANNQLQTFWAQLGLLKDRIVDVGIELGGPLVAALQDHVMPALESAIDVTGRFFDALFDPPSNKKTIDAIRGIEVKVDDTSGAAENLAKQVREAFRDFQAALKENWPAIKEIFANLKEVVLDVADIFGQEMAMMSSDTADMSDDTTSELEELVEALKVLSGTAKTVSEATSTAWSVMTALVVPSSDRMAAALDKITGGAFVRFQEGAKESFQGVADHVERGARIVRVMWLEATEFIVDKMATFATEVLELADRAFGWVPKLSPKLDDARDAVQEFREKANKNVDMMRRPDLRPRTEGLDTSIRRLQHLQQILEGMPGGIQLVGTGQGDGPGWGIPQVSGSARAMAEAAMAAVPGSQYITSSYRSPAHNAAVGGSPTSYHMDRSNPAVDIGGENLNAVFATLQAMGGYRELLGPPNDPRSHGDHVHVADRGGWLRSGEAAVNLTGRMEAVLTPSQSSALVGLASALESGRRSEAKTVTINGPLVNVEGSLDGQTARRTVAEVESAVRAAVRAG